MFKKILLICLALICLFSGAILTVKNSQQVTLDYYTGTLELPFIAYLLLSLTGGAILGLLVSSFWLYGQRRQIKRLEQSKALVQKELDNLRSLRSEVAE